MNPNLAAYALDFMMSAALAFVVLNSMKSAKHWFMFAAVLPIPVYYVVNPSNRLLGDHNLIHAGIVYRILNGGAPPNEPFLAGFVQQYYWGYHYLAGWITRILGMSPLYSFALINVASLWLSIYLIYLISRNLVVDDKANVLSVVAALYAFGPKSIILALMDLFRRSGLQTEHGPVLIRKFITASGHPAGLVFYLLCLDALIRIFKGRGVVRSHVLLLIGIVGCGFFYHAMLPSVIGVVLIVCLADALPSIRYGPIHAFKKSAGVLLVLSAGLICLYPYLDPISGNTLASGIGFLGRLDIKIPHYLVMTAPMIVVIWSQRAFFRDIDRAAVLVVGGSLLANLLLYLVVQVYPTNEYKFLVASCVSMGIFGGIAFKHMLNRVKAPFVLALLMLFCAPVYALNHSKMNFLRRIHGHYFYEKGRHLFVYDREENGLYAWIRSRTPTDACFLDSEPGIPVFAQRGLYLVFRKKDARLPGYSRGLRQWLVDRRYDRKVISYRAKVLSEIYVQERPASRFVEKFFERNPNLYIVVRDKTLQRKFRSGRFARLYRSPSGRFAVFRYAGA